MPRIHVAGLPHTHERVFLGIHRGPDGPGAGAQAPGHVHRYHAAPTTSLQEVIDNSVDEALAGHARPYRRGAWAPTRSLSVTDDGRGMPVDLHPEHEDQPGVELILTTPARRRQVRRTSTTSFSGGLHGVGVSVVNALSSELDGRPSAAAGAAARACATPNGEPQQGPGGRSIRVAPRAARAPACASRRTPKYFDSPRTCSSCRACSTCCAPRRSCVPGLHRHFSRCPDGETRRSGTYDGWPDETTCCARRAATPRLPAGAVHGQSLSRTDSAAADFALLWLPEGGETGAPKVLRQPHTHVRSTAPTSTVCARG
jgi:topoisomerase-4 subunit B